MQSISEILVEHVVLNEGTGKYWSLYFGGLLGLGVHYLYSRSNLDKITRDPKFKKAINKQAAEAVADAKKNNKNLTEDLPAGFVNGIKKWWSRDDASIFADWNVHINKNDYYTLSDKYCLGISYDTDSIRKIDVCLYDKVKDKFVWKSLAVPAGYGENV